MLNNFYIIITLIKEFISLLWTISDVEKVKKKYAVIISLILVSSIVIGTLIKIENNSDKKIAIVYAKNIEANVNIRDDNEKIIDKLKPFTYVNIISKSPEWIKVKYHNGKEGWISSKYIKEIEVNCKNEY